MTDNGHGQLLDFTKGLDGPPAPQLNGAAILTAVSDFIRRFVYLDEQQARVAAVWVAHTHALGAATTTPYLAINSATKQSGKTRLLEVFELLVSKPWLTGRVTAAVLVRKVDQVHPTLLLDESDAAFNGEKEYAEALRGILNTGFYSGGVASCCVGQGVNIGFKDFKTYCAKAIAGIGQLPDTVADRSIPIRLQRKRPGEAVARFRRRHAKGDAATIKAELSDWIGIIADKLRTAEPSLPRELTDRQQDGLEPLFAIADEAGGEWPSAIRAAAVEIFHSQAAEDQDVGVKLLADIRTIFDTATEDKISSVDLVENLKQIETSPWADWSKGKGITPNGIARLLKRFEVGPRNMRVDERVVKGYPREVFADAWERYLSPLTPSLVAPAAQPGVSTATALQPACLLSETHFSNRYTNPNVAVAKSASNPHEHCIVAAVAVAKAPRAGGGTKERTLPSCSACGSYAVYREADGRQICQTCAGPVN